MMKYMIILAVILSSCATNKRVSRYDKQMFDRQYIKIDRNWDWLEDWEVKRLVKRLGVNEKVETKEYVIVKDIYAGKVRIYNFNEVSYIPISSIHLCKHKISWLTKKQKFYISPNNKYSKLIQPEID